MTPLTRRLPADAVATWNRGAAPGRPRRRHLPESRLRWRPSGPDAAARRRRLLPGFLVLRRTSRRGDLAFAGYRELAAGGAGAAPADRVGLGLRPAPTRRSVLRLHPGSHGSPPVDLRHSRRQHRRPVERPDRLRPPGPHRSGACRGRGRRALPVTRRRGPRGQWRMVYHGYENALRTLGRRTPLEPVDWSAGGWPVAAGGDLSRPLAMPATREGARQHGASRAATPACCSPTTVGCTVASGSTGRAS